MKPIDSFDFVDTIDTEVLVVGAGNAGASAFLAAVESGVDTLLDVYKRQSYLAARELREGRGWGRGGGR